MRESLALRYLLLTIRPVLEDLAGTLAFYALFLLTGDARLGAGVGLAIGVAQVLAHRWRAQRIPALLATGVALTLLLGLATMVSDDPRFLLMKPSIVYAAVGATMLPRGWVRRYLPTIALDLLPARTLDRVGWGWAALLFGTAALNVALIAALPPARAALAFLIWGVCSKLALFGAQFALLYPRAKRAALAGGTLR